MRPQEKQRNYRMTCSPDVAVGTHVGSLTLEVEETVRHRHLLRTIRVPGHVTDWARSSFVISTEIECLSLCMFIVHQTFILANVE